MKSRLKEWEEIDFQSYPICNLVWCPLANDICFGSINPNNITKFINHFEGHYQISNKLRLFENILDFVNVHRYSVNLFSFFLYFIFGKYFFLFRISYCYVFAILYNQ